MDVKTRAQAGFQEDQPRDEQGQWTDVGGGLARNVPLTNEQIAELDQAKKEAEAHHHAEGQHAQHEAEHLETGEILFPATSEDALAEITDEHSEFMSSAALSEAERNAVDSVRDEDEHVGWNIQLRTNPDAINGESDEAKQMRAFNAATKSAPGRVPPITTYMLTARTNLEIGDEIQTKGFNESSIDSKIPRRNVRKTPADAPISIFKISNPQGLIVDSDRAVPNRHIAPHGSKYVVAGFGWTHVGKRRVDVYEVEQVWIH